MTDDIFSFLDQHEIPFKEFQHPPLFTCEDAQRHNISLPGADTKNLFLRDKKGVRHFLFVCPHAVRVDLEHLAQIFNADRLSFGSSERLKRFLGVDPGAVSILGLFSDKERSVEVFIDERVWQAEEIQAHPLVNTATLVLEKSALMRFLEVTGHSYKVVSLK